MLIGGSDPAREHAFAKSVPARPAFGETNRKLNELSRRFKLAIVSSIDDHLIYKNPTALAAITIDRLPLTAAAARPDTKPTAAIGATPVTASTYAVLGTRVLRDVCSRPLAALLVGGLLEFCAWCTRKRRGLRTRGLRLLGFRLFLSFAVAALFTVGHAVSFRQS